MYRKICVAVCMLFAVSSVMAQDFKGMIMNHKQRPLKGMKVWRKNTTESVKTDKMGNFAFTGLTAKDTLVIIISKKEEAVFPVGDLKSVDIKIEKEYYLLHDGQKEQKREYRKVSRTRLNSNVLTREQILRLSANNIYDLLKGSIPGVNVTFGDGGQKIAIRGANSLEQDTEPLFIVDGAQYENSSDVDSSVNVNDIQRVEVSKDGAGYGIKGANGVIIITTLKK